MNPSATSLVGDTVRTWVKVGWVFTAVYLLLGLQQFVAKPALYWVTGFSILIAATLFGVGSFSGMKGHFSRARWCMIFGGILGLPLGIVMLVAARKFNKATSFEDFLVRAQRDAEHDGRIDLKFLSSRYEIDETHGRALIDQAQNKGLVPRETVVD